MQECLNNDHKTIIQKFKKHPFLWVILAVYILFTIVFAVIGYYCMAGWRCPEQMGGMFTLLAVILTMLLIIFVPIPYLIRILLNFFYPLPREASIPFVARSRSRSKTQIELV